jgi:hypothetical protein
LTTWPPLNVPALPLWLLSPKYVAVIVSVPTGRTEVVHVATPGLPDVTVVVPQPVFVLHVTFPVTSFGFACPLTSPYWPLIVAVNVTLCPNVDEFRLDVTTVPAVADPTTWPPPSVPVLPGKFKSPEYTAVTVCVPIVSVEMLPDVAQPETSVTGEPKALPSILNCTVPVGVPVPAVTLAVKLTAWPYVEGSRLEATAVAEPA